MITQPVLPASSLLIERHLEFLASQPSAQQPWLAAGQPQPVGPAGGPVSSRPWLGTDFGYLVVAR